MNEFSKKILAESLVTKPVDSKELSKLVMKMKLTE